MFGVYEFYKSENVTQQCNICTKRIDLNHCKKIGHAGLFPGSQLTKRAGSVL